jgi:cytochrome c peroxidase
VRFYNDLAGHAAPIGEHLTIDWRMTLRRPVLGENDISDLVAFLRALTDESLIPPIPDRVPSGLNVVYGDRYRLKAEKRAHHR